MIVSDTPPGSAPDRRPLASRSWRPMRSLASMLVGAGVPPNAISLFSIVAGAGAGAALGITGDTARLWLDPWLFSSAALLVQLRLLCNLMDGMVAIEGGRSTPVGDLYNEIPDRVSDIAIFVGAGYAVGSSPTLGYLAALGAVLTAYVRAVGKAATGTNDFRGPMAKPHRMFLVTLVTLFLALAPAGWVLPTFGFCPPSPLTPMLAVIALGCVVTAARRLAGIARALRGPPA